jgi:hypothetical protein
MTRTVFHAFFSWTAPPVLYAPQLLIFHSEYLSWYILCINHNCYLYCCCVSIIIVICTCPPGALIWLINLFYSILYMILILPCHCLIYDPDSSPSCTVLYMILNLPRHCLIYDPESFPSLPYIWSWFFPVTVLYITKNNWNLSFIHYFFILPFMEHLYIAWQFSPYREESGYRPHFIGYICILISVSSTYANILKYHIQGMPANIILQEFI